MQITFITYVFTAVDKTICNVSTAKLKSRVRVSKWMTVAKFCLRENDKLRKLPFIAYTRKSFQSERVKKVKFLPLILIFRTYKELLEKFVHLFYLTLSHWRIKDLL